MKYNLYTTSKKSWNATLKAIALAEKSIYIEMYIFLDDMVGNHDFVEILKTKALSGIEVVIIADSYGSSGLKKEAIAELRQAKVEIIFFSSWLRRTHRKIIIIDQKIAFLGGVNIEKKIINWQDMQIRLEGRKTVNAISRSLAYTYKMAGGKKPHIIALYKKSLIKIIKSLLIERLPGHNPYSLSDYFKDRILNAKHSVRIVTPYFIPPRWLIALFDEALKRGVRIEIIIPRDTDIKSLNKVNYAYINKLLPLGINFFASKKMNHAKILIIDDKECLVGSQNIDILSFNVNFEVGVFLKQKNIVKDVHHIFEKWKRQSIPFTSLNYRPNFGDKIIIIIFKLFYSIF